MSDSFLIANKEKSHKKPNCFLHRNWESDNISLFEQLGCSVIHQMAVKSVFFLTDKVSQVWGVQPLHHSRLNFAWLWAATCLIFLLSLLLSSSFLSWEVFLYLHLFLPWHHIKLISSNYFLFPRENFPNPRLKLWGEVPSSCSSLTANSPCDKVITVLH